MSIQYPVPGFKLKTFWTRVSYFNHQTIDLDMYLNEMIPDQGLPSLMSLASSHGGFDSLPNGVRPSFRRKSLVDRKISVSSIMSDDSMDFMEEAGRAVGSAVGFSRMNSTPM